MREKELVQRRRKKKRGRTEEERAKRGRYRVRSPKNGERGFGRLD